MKNGEEEEKREDEEWGGGRLGGRKRGRGSEGKGIGKGYLLIPGQKVLK